MNELIKKEKWMNTLISTAYANDYDISLSQCL